ncbi:peroxidase-related enzyme (plasmid) [Agrobacterium vitis]|uniref:Peroxidase-related enzyme n=1 Tax=Agrobacterium vitis TaxID=373 RepID=A0AAE2UP02_AGRVI|nr:peroxidase-related enzyme [Agrobacterium vitis]
MTTVYSVGPSISTENGMTTIDGLARSQRISRLRIPDESELPEDIQALVDRHHHENWVRALSLNPDTARRFTGHFEHLFAATGRRLPLQDRELIAVVVSATNGCGVCEIHHTRAFGDLLNDPGFARRVALDYHLADLSKRQRALADLAVKVTLSPKTISQADFEKLRDLELSDEELLEAVETASWFNHTNRVTISLGILPDDKFFS